MPILREACSGDVDALIPLLDQLFSIESDFSPDPERQRRGLEALLQSATAYVAVAELAGELVGMATLQIVISTAEGGAVGWIEDVVVNASQRGRGIGKALLDHLIGWSQSRGLTRLQLLADRDNQPALDFYRKQGWAGTKLMALRKFP